MARPSKSIVISGVMLFLVTMATADENNCKDMGTFNAGLLVHVPQADIRRPAIIEALKTSTADVMCLQEVWFEKDMSAILDEVEGRFPHHYSKIHADDGSLRPSSCIEPEETAPKETPCTTNETTVFVPLLLGCGQQNGCFEQEGLAQGVCLATMCAAVLRQGTASENCISCLFINVGLSLQQSLAQCLMPRAVHNRLNNPGLLVLSKTSFSNISYSSYFPDNAMAFERGYIEFELEDGRLGVCTHLSSINPFYIEYDLPFTSFAEQSKAEIETLGVTVANKEYVLLGDFNAGPKVVDSADPEKNLSGELPENYELLTSFGYVSPYLHQDGRCTFCSANPLTRGQSNNVIDHVMISNASSLSTPFVSREYDMNDPPLSDHYWVQVRICDAEQQNE